MALPTSGRLTAPMINAELGRGAYDYFTLNDSEVRELGSKPSGRIAYSDLRGKSAAKLQATLTIVERRLSHAGYHIGEGERSPTTYSYGVGWIRLSNDNRYGDLVPKTTTDGNIIQFLGEESGGKWGSPATAKDVAGGVISIDGSPPGDFWSEMVIDGLVIKRTGLGNIPAGDTWRLWKWREGDMNVKDILGGRTSGSVSFILR